MKSTCRQTMSPDNSQDFRSIINQMKTWGDARVVSKNIYIDYSQRLKTLKSLQEISTLLSGMLFQNVFPNTVIINQLIKKLNQLKRIDFVLEIHGIAAARKIADAITYNSTITAIAKSASPDATFETLAFSLIDEAKQRFNLPDMQHGNLIDLHNLSYGEVYFGLKRRLKIELANINSPEINLQIIYGRGLHSHTSFAAGYHPLKEAVIRLMQEMSTQGVSGEESPDNPGRFALKIKRSVQSSQQQSSALTLNSIFSDTRKTNLNPNATVFVPRAFQEQLNSTPSNSMKSAYLT